MQALRTYSYIILMLSMFADVRWLGNVGYNAMNHEYIPSMKTNDQPLQPDPLTTKLTIHCNNLFIPLRTNQVFISFRICYLDWLQQVTVDYIQQLYC